MVPFHSAASRKPQAHLTKFLAAIATATTTATAAAAAVISAAATSAAPTAEAPAPFPLFTPLLGGLPEPTHGLPHVLGHALPTPLL
jgi:hypothetical protein